MASLGKMEGSTIGGFENKQGNVQKTLKVYCNILTVHFIYLESLIRIEFQLQE